ncbi:hypothetical protein Vadar_011402 [Vaccinium darrowii]|nr:hypothetical protein Vadar_011402 [Vaccinium darrowii]
MTEEKDMAKDIAKEAAQRLGHDDPLMLITKEETEDSWDLTCYGCQKPILDMSFYGCKDCLFFLHRSCSNPPRELTHPHHPQTPPQIPFNPAYQGTCDVCGEDLKRFTYHCSRCKYDIDMKCALVMLSIQQSIQHKSHPHQLIPLLHESIFLCAACGIKHQGTSFLCTTCGYWINQKCASSPLNLKLSDHPGHTLSLFYFIEEHFYLPCCKICFQTIHRRYWVYRCSKCKSYVVHLQCAANNKTKTEQLDSTNSATATSDFELSKVPSMKIKAQEPIIDPRCRTILLILLPNLSRAPEYM